MELINAFLKARLLAYVVLRGGGNRRSWGKPPTFNGRPLPCHMPIPWFELEQASVLPLLYPGLDDGYEC